MSSYITKHIILFMNAGWARDLPADAHGPRKEAVVTAPTLGHLFAMAHLEKLGDLSSAERPAEVSLQCGADYVKPFGTRLYKPSSGVPALFVTV